MTSTLQSEVRPAEALANAALRGEREIQQVPRRQGGSIGVMLLISSLEHGGAERQVVELANAMDPRLFDVTVCSLSRQVPLADRLDEAAHRLRIVEKRCKFDASLVWRVARLMRQRRVQIAHAFLGDAEIVARLAARLAGVPVVVSSERNTDYRRSLAKILCLRLTRPFFDVMIANSAAGKRFDMRTLGLPSRRIRVIHNGVNVDYFRRRDAAALREGLGIGPVDPVVGMVAMFKRQKRHEDFLRMAQALLRRFGHAWFLLAGEPLRGNQGGAQTYHEEIRRLMVSLDAGRRCLLLGNRDDMPWVYSACDVIVLPSSREGTPNVLLEAMACQTPVVATRVADNARIVPDGQAGFLVRLGDVDALIQRVTALLSDAALRAACGRFGRRWVEREFCTAALAGKTQAVYAECYRRKLAQRD